MNTTGLYCSNCGQLNDADALFCSRCGARQRPLSEGERATGTTPSTPPPASFHPASPAIGQQVGSYEGGAYQQGSYAGGQYGAATPAAYGAVPMYRGYGGFWLRVVAAIIDFIVVNVIALPIRAIFFGTTVLPGIMHGGEPNVAAIATGAMFGGLFQLAIAWVYEAGLESSRYQATLGKMALGMKVTDLNGYRISFARATGRHFAKYLSGMILFIGYIMVAFTERKQGLHDMLAGTLVVKT